MSHFSTLVIGEDVEELLAPYDENTEVEPYVEENGDDYQTTLAEARKYTDAEDSDEVALSKWGYGPEMFDEQGRRLTTYNPLSKWDWWTIGGRYAQRLYNQATGQWVDQLRVKELGLDHMTRQAHDAARQRWDEYEWATANTVPMTVDWLTYRKEFEEEGLGIAEVNNRASAALNSGPHAEWHKKASVLVGFFNDPVVEFCTSSEEPFQTYLERAELRALSAYAYVDADGWHERGQMGWFGMASNEEDEIVWLRRLRKRLRDLSGDTLLTVVDCHI